MPHVAQRAGGGRKYLVLTAMIFAVSMLFVDQTIVAIAIPKIQTGLTLSATGSQWVINGYLLALAALFAFGGKLTDVLGHRRMVIVGVIGFATASALCGAAPAGQAGEWWLIGFRVVQGAFGAVLFPAALAIVVNSFEPRERGKALAIFFGITGGLTVGRADRGQLPPAVDLALDLLDQRADRADRARVDPPGQSGRRAKARSDRLARRRARLRGDGPRSARAPAGRPVGLELGGDLGLRRSRRGRARRLRHARAADPRSADRSPHLQAPRLRGRQHRPVPALHVLRAAVLLRLDLRAGRARRQRGTGGPLHPHLLPGLRRREPARRAHSRPAWSAPGRCRRIRSDRSRLLALGRPAAARKPLVAVVLDRPRPVRASVSRSHLSRPTRSTARLGGATAR